MKSWEWIKCLGNSGNFLKALQVMKQIYSKEAFAFWQPFGDAISGPLAEPPGLNWSPAFVLFYNNALQLHVHFLLYNAMLFSWLSNL